jgi:hypothetical protein
MRARVRAFATLAAVGILVLTAALLSGSVLSSQQLVLDQGRAEKEVSSRAAAWKAIDSILTALQTTWNSDEETFDAWYAGQAQALPAGSSLQSLSGRINLNSMTPFLLQDTALVGTLLGRSVVEFTDYRTNKGPFTRLGDYKEYFKPEALKRLYCVHSSFDVNTADEIILEKVIAARTGNEALAANVRARVREFRTARQAMTDSDWEMLVGAEKDAIGDLVTVYPELDVNTAPPDVLQAVLRDPDYKLDQADAKVQTIVNGRASKPWTDDTLCQALGLANTAPLMQYLGTRCHFIEGSLPQGDSIFYFVVKLSYSTDSPPKIASRVLETRVEAAQ